MAGPSVGHIEVTVDADTGKLKAQIVRAGKEAGEAGGEAIEEGLSDVDGKELMAKLRKIRIQAQRAMAGLEVDIDFHADPTSELARVEAQIRAAQIELFLTPEVKDADLERALADVRARIALARPLKIEGEVVFDPAEARAAVAEADAILEQAHITVEAELNLDAKSEADFMADMRRAMAEAQVIAENVNVEFEIEMRTALAKAEGEALRQEIEDLEAEMQLKLDTHEATLELFGFKRRTEADDIEMAVELELARAKLAADRFRLEQAVNDIQMGIDVDPELTRANAEMMGWRRRQEADKLEIEVEAKPARGGRGGLSGDMTKYIVGAIVTMGDALASGLSGVVAAATSVVSSAFQALGASAGAAIPLVAGLGAALAGGVVGAQGFGDALGVVNEEFAKASAAGRPMNRDLIETSAAFRNLAPSARDAASAFLDIRERLGDVRREVQGDLFAGVGDDIRRLGPTLGDVSQALQISAQSVNAFGRELMAVARNTDFIGTMKAIDPALDDALDGALALAQTLEPFLKAAAPAAEQLAEMFERGAESLRDWVQANPTEIAEFLDEGLVSLRHWGALLQSTGDLLVTIFDAGAESGDGFVISLNNMIERWDAFLESTEGQNALTEFFESGQSAMEALKPVLDGLKEAFAILITPETMGRFDELAAAVGAALPAVAQFLSLMGKLGLAEAFANLVGSLTPVLDVLNNIDADLLGMVGTAVVVVGAITKITNAIKLAGAAMKLAFASNPWLLGLAAVITGVVIAMDALGGKSQDVAARTDELSAALQNNVDAMIASKDAATDAGLGMDALNKTIFETGDGGKKLQQAFADINSGAGDASLGIEDTTSVLLSMKDQADGGAAALAELAEGYGLPKDAAQALGEIVASTDANMKTAAASGTTLGHKMTDLAEKTGIPREELVKLFGALEETQDQAENLNLEDVTNELLRIASTGTEAEQAMLNQAEAIAAAGGKAGDSVAIYQEYVDLLAESRNASDDAAEGVDNHSNALDKSQQAFMDSAAAASARNAALKEAGAAAMEAYKAEELLATATERAAVAMAADMGISPDIAQGFVDAGNAARQAADDANAFANSLQLLIAPAASVDANLDAFAQAVIDANTALEENGQTLDRNTQAGLDNKEALRQMASSALDTAAAQISAGATAAEVTDTYNAQRLTLYDTAKQFGATDEEAQKLTDTMLGQPGVVETLISMPGLTDALLNADTLTLAYDELGNPVITEIEAMGLDLTTDQTNALMGLMDTLGIQVATPTVDAAGIPETTAGVEGVGTAVAGVDGQTATVNTEIANNMVVMVQLGYIQSAMENLAGMSASPKVSLPTYGAVIQQVGLMMSSLRNLNAMTASPKVTLPTFGLILAQVGIMAAALKTLGGVHAQPRVSLPTFGTVLAQVAIMAGAINAIPSKTVSVTANVYGLDAVRNLKSAIDSLTSKSVTVTSTHVTNNVVNNTTTTTGGMAGAMITAPRTMHVGERGYAEALIPLQLPLNRVNPEVRQLAAILRGEAPMAGPRAVPSPGKVVNNYMTITPQSADPVAVGQQVINRAAALANR